MYELDQYTVSLLHFDGSLKDESGKVWTARNGAAISTTQSKFGGSSLYLSGTNQYLTTTNSTDFDFGSGDFTVDWWEYRETGNGNNRAVFVRDGADTTAFEAFLIGNVDVHGTGMSSSFSSNNTSWDINPLILADTAILNAWTHYAVVRSGNIFYGFQNGILINTMTSSLSLAPSNGNPAIGKYFDKYQNTFSGYIDEFRVSKGIARWTSNFDPEASSNGNGLLRLTMNDSSEREYRLSTVEIEKFIKWYDRTVCTGNTCYSFDDIVDGSKEYLSFEKIISFKVIPLTK